MVELCVELGLLFRTVVYILRYNEVAFFLDSIDYFGLHLGNHLLQRRRYDLLQPPPALLGLDGGKTKVFILLEVQMHTHTEKGSVKTSRETTVTRMIVVE